MIRHTLQVIVFLGFYTALVLLAAARADDESYKISRSTIDGGGVMFSVGGDYELSGTIAQPDAGTLTGAEFSLNGGFWFEITAGDCDQDGFTSFSDFTRFSARISGPLHNSAGSCTCADTDADGHVDLRDFAAFQRTFAGQ